MVTAILGVLGLIMGSFVNALVWRLHNKSKKKNVAKDFSILSGRSMCPNCLHHLAAKDLIPIVSWLLLRGKCRYCHKPISAQYPLVELLVGGLFILSYLFWPSQPSGLEGGVFGLWLAIIVVLVALAVYDAQWYLLPNGLVFISSILAIASIVLIALEKNISVISVIEGSAWGALILGGAFFVLFQLSDGKWIGGGDVKLGAVLGALVGGPLNTVLLLLFASTTGTLYSLPLVASGKANRTSHVPFGPFLIFAAFFVRLFGSSIVHWYKGLYF